MKQTKPTGASARNRLLAIGSAALLALLVSGLRAADETRPAAPPPPSRPMAEPYHILLVRSIFSRDHNRAAPLIRTYATPTTQSVALDPSSAAAQLAAAQAEANFLLKGVSVEDGVPGAFFEQTSAGQLFRVRAGEPISHGKLVNITLDGVDYSNGVTVNRIAIGQALDGGSAAPTTQPSTAMTATVTEHPAGDKPSWWRRSK